MLIGNSEIPRLISKDIRYSLYREYRLEIIGLQEDCVAMRRRASSQPELQNMEKSGE